MREQLKFFINVLLSFLHYVYFIYAIFLRMIAYDDNAKSWSENKLYATKYIYTHTHTTNGVLT